METASMNSQVLHEQSVWENNGTVAYYHSHRQKPEDLYESERYFLPQVLPQVESVLDVGCATGAFSDIMKSFNPGLRYTGIDVIPEFVSIAKAKHPKDSFHYGDGIHFPFPPASFDLVFATGVLHLNSKYDEMLRAMWNLAKRYVLCDFRLTWGPQEIGAMAPPGVNGSEKVGSLPYHVLNVASFIGFLERLTPAPAVIQAKGYTHPVSPEARITTQNVIMAFFLLDKGPAPQKRIDLDFEIRQGKP